MTLNTAKTNGFFGLFSNGDRNGLENQAKVDAISKSQAMIEFNMDGTVITANDNFCNAVGYTLDELVGAHHRTFCEKDYAHSTEYRQFWEKLNHGEFDSGMYKRIAKGCREIYIRATYNPIFDANGKPYKVVKFATDITEQTLKNADFAGKVDAISKSQAMIEFNMDGTVITANDNFCNAVGYALDELVGVHHRTFCEKDYAHSTEYKQFWEKLNRGEFDSGEYKRIAKGGREIYIQASYNPIFDPNGKLYKVVKFATDITEQTLKNADFAGKVDAISKSQAMIEFNMDGTVITANNNFCNAIGYTLDELTGIHHRTFCENSYAQSTEYTQFWEKLNRGEFDSGEYKRIAKGGREIYIQATYNPIFDPNGKPYKVVKFATDITEKIHKVNQILEAVTAMSQGDLTREIEVSGNDDLGQIGNGLQQLLETLRKNITVLSSNSGSLSAASQQLTATSQQMANNAENTASQSNIMSAAAELSAMSMSLQEIVNLFKLN
ncbi:MAG: PAS domain-containing protein [Candidatus Nitrohelix vancouverensis]|uniref:PAS domain-containing protein n=1 Tax=Candidatus Nitrohelix vancouverensis TaxID=2705534 RepID=A0A7T0C064_9BACT|nr:MAG: PAS domain-containing protein [Candidatus Nitrohelix vancouverensis]